MENQSNSNDQSTTRQQFVKPKRKTEISPEAQEERRLLSAFLLDKTEELKKERNKRKQKLEAETIELRSGKTISILQIKQFVTSLKRPYEARFPNDNAFFKHMFRLHPKLQGHDPNKYEKPYLAGKLLKKLTYGRFYSEFAIDVLPALIVFAMPDGVWLHKCHEYLTDSGVVAFTRFRDEANEMMAKYENLKWYDFDKEYSTKYKLPFQPRLL